MPLNFSGMVSCILLAVPVPKAADAPALPFPICCRLWHFPETMSLTHVKRRLFNTVFDRTRRKRTVDSHMGTVSSGLSKAVPQGYIHQSSHKRQAEHLSCRPRQTGTGTL